MDIVAQSNVRWSKDLYDANVMSRAPGSNRPSGATSGSASNPTDAYIKKLRMF